MLTAAAVLFHATTAAQAIIFQDVAAPAGLTFTLHNSPTPEKHMIETMAGGLAAFDYDGDGLTDLFFTNGAALPTLDKSAPRFWNRLFRNEGNWRFRDVTEAAGLPGAGYSMGAAAGDFDNDGHPDLFVAGVYRNQLFRNLGNGRFADVTAKSGILSNIWSVGGGWFDYDNDGRLDLFVVNYSHWKAANPRFCGDTARQLRVYCHPRYFEAVPNQLYRNRGNGVFEDVSRSTGVAAHKGRGMSVAFHDYDRDGRPDVFVTNDNLPNFLFHQTRDGRFEEVALAAGAAMSDSGKPVAAMGVDWRDFDNDGRADLAFTALAGETFPLFRAEAGGLFRDVTYLSKLAALVAKKSGWGVTFADFDNDGWRDLFTANSHVNDIIDQFESLPYKEPNSVFRNQRDGTFAAVPASGLASRIAAHRGSVIADFDNDGRLDAAVSTLGAPAELWRNTTPNAPPSVRVILEGTRSNRDGIGARLQLGQQTDWLQTAVSYSSSAHAGVHLAWQPGPLTVEWPSGVRQTIPQVEPGQTIRVKEPAR